MRDVHPGERVLRAYLDRELGWRQAAACAMHLRRCERCQGALDAERQLEQRAGQLLRRLGPGTDTSAGWHGVRARAAAERQPLWRAARWPLGIGAAVLPAALVLLLRAAPAPSADDAPAGTTTDVCCWDLDGGGRGDDGVFTRSHDGQVVECVILYDDIDGSGSFTASDVIRNAPLPTRCHADAATP